MRKFALEDFHLGWFIGNFEPSVLRTDAFEIAVKKYSQGDTEEMHYQLVAQEVTVVISGKCVIGGQTMFPGEIILIEAKESAEFHALEDTVLVAVKSPSAPEDKKLGFFNEA